MVEEKKGRGEREEVKKIREIEARGD